MESHDVCPMGGNLNVGLTVAGHLGGSCTQSRLCMNSSCEFMRPAALIVGWADWVMLTANPKQLQIYHSYSGRTHFEFYIKYGSETHKLYKEAQFSLNFSTLKSVNNEQ